MTEKEALQAKARELGLDDQGTIAELQDRIAARENPEPRPEDQVEPTYAGLPEEVLDDPTAVVDPVDDYPPRPYSEAVTDAHRAHLEEELGEADAARVLEG